MKHYKAPNKRMIARGSNGRFRNTTFADIGIHDIADGARWCAKCHHKWFPLVESGKCPECNSQDKLDYKSCVSLGYVVVNEIKVSCSMIDPRIFNELTSGQKFEAEVIDDSHIYLPRFKMTFYVIGGSFTQALFEIPKDKKGFIYLKEKWFYFTK